MTEQTAAELVQENRRLKAQMVQNQSFAIIFSTPIPEAGGKTAKDCEANRETIKEWATYETEPITNVRVWWTGIFKQNPALATQEYGQIVWEPLPRSKAEIEDEANEQLIADLNTFDDFARSTGLLSRSHANFLETRRTLGPGLPNLSFAISRDVNENGKRDIFGENGESELDPPTRAELAQFAKEKQNIDQDKLKDMARRQDIAGLYARSRRDHERNAQTDAATAQEYQLSKGYEREVLQGGFTESLPASFLGKPLDSAAIRALFSDRPSLKFLIEKYGNARVTARLNGIKKVRRFDHIGNPINNAPEYVFEK